MLKPISKRASTCMLPAMVAAKRCHISVSHLQRLPFSTFSKQKRDSLSDSPGPARLPNPQDFVRVRLEPGEWDPDRKDPIYRPPWRNDAKIMHPDDYAMKSRSVLGNGRYASIHDSMHTFGWINAKEQDAIYQAYLDMCQRMTASTNGTTSHEYIFRVLAQKFNLSSERVAGWCVLKHNEEQMKARGETLYYDHQDYADEQAAKHIQAIYTQYREVNPQRFVEPVVGNPPPEATDDSYVAVDDLIDVDSILEEVNIREKEEARVVIDSWVYHVDVDENTIPVNVTPAIKKIMAQQAKWSTYDHAQRPGDIKPLPGGGAEPKRPRFKYAAYFVETPVKKQKHRMTNRKKKEQAMKCTDNAIIELDGQVRVATLEESKGCSWKPKRNDRTFIYQTLQTAWLARQKSGSMAVWGRQEAPVVAPTEIEAASEEGSEGATDDDAANVSTEESPGAEKEEEGKTEEGDGEKKD